METVKEWRVIFLVNAVIDKSNTAIDIEQYLSEFMTNIQASQLSGRNSYVVILNKIKVEHLTGSISENTFLYEILPADDRKGYLNLVKSFDNAYRFLYQSSMLCNTMEEIDRQKRWRAKKTIFCTWGHGSGFGVFKELKEERILKTPSMPSHTMPEFVLLNNEDLSAIISTRLKEKVDILLMANCYMQNLHTAAAFRNCVKYIVAPQGNFEYPTYDFAGIINFIENCNAAKIKSLLNYIINSTGQQVAYPRPQLMTLFATDIKKLRKIEKKLDQLGLYFIKLLENGPVFQNAFISTLKYCFDFSTNRNYSLIDITNFLYRFKENYHIITNPSARQSIISNIDDFITSFKILTEKYCICSDTGINFMHYSASPQYYYTNITPQALSIYFPDFSCYFKEELIKKIAFDSELLKKSNWKEFILKLYSDYSADT